MLAKPAARGVMSWFATTPPHFPRPLWLMYSTWPIKILRIFEVFFTIIAHFGWGQAVALFIQFQFLNPDFHLFTFFNQLSVLGIEFKYFFFFILITLFSFHNFPLEIGNSLFEAVIFFYKLKLLNVHFNPELFKFLSEGVPLINQCPSVELILSKFTW